MFRIKVIEVDVGDKVNGTAHAVVLSTAFASMSFDAAGPKHAEVLAALFVQFINEHTLDDAELVE